MTDKAVTVAGLNAERIRIEGRLLDGYHKIGTAEQEGKETDAWFAHWIELLRAYERICDELVEAA